MEILDSYKGFLIKKDRFGNIKIDSSIISVASFEVAKKCIDVYYKRKKEKNDSKLKLEYGSNIANKVAEDIEQEVAGN